MRKSEQVRTWNEVEARSSLIPYFNAATKFASIYDKGSCELLTAS